MTLMVLFSYDAKHQAQYWFIGGFFTRLMFSSALWNGIPDLALYFIINA